MPSGPHNQNLDDLLAHGEWLNRLARQLAGSPAEADDLLQDTWLAALRSPPDSKRPPRPWLATVMHNLRRLYARRAVRRRRRDSIIAPTLDVPQAPDTQALVERVELQRLIARMLLELDEPYKTTVLLTFFDGRSSPEISRLTGVPEGTVRWRLKEALSRLRVQLDERHGGSRSSWAVLVAPFGRPAQILSAGKGVLLVAAKSKALVLAAAISSAVAVVGAGVTLIPSRTPELTSHPIEAPARRSSMSSTPAPIAVERPARKPSVVHIRPPRFVPVRRGSDGVARPTVLGGLGPDRSVSPVDLFNTEKRDPVWSAAMEWKIKELFSSQRMASLGLPGMRVSALECRASACRIALEWPPELEDHLQQAKLIKPSEDAMLYLRKKQGHLATNTTWLTMRPIIHSNGNFRHEYLLAFSEADIDPERYEAGIRKQEADRAAGIRPVSPFRRDIRIPAPPR